MSHELETQFFPHDTIYRAYDKEQRRRMLDFHGPERIKRKNAHQIASMLRIPFRSYRENFGYESIDVGYLVEVVHEYSEVISAENKERERRIKEFEDIDVEIPYSLAHIIRCSNTYVAPEIGPDITIDTERSLINFMRKLKSDTEVESPTILHRDVNTSWLALAMNKISEVMKTVVGVKPAASTAAP